ncbi:MAG: Rrf2 family transcriptional regulator [Clostridiales Family XIII bacterium]|jgi:Rrf2 family protein|nr:Rrf2 family transcriptional regulator [Clostridiales Family XIII bacterium]
MRISVKGRYALAAIIRIASESGGGGNISVNNIAESLGISKIYLEQVFAQMKKAGLLTSIKGPRGGYQLAREPVEMTAWDVLTALELSLTEKTENTVEVDAPDIETAMQTKVFNPLDAVVEETLRAITIRDLRDFVGEQGQDLSFMLNM